MHVHNLDFHYHAGQERPPGTSVRDFVEHARVTGRLVLGLTDHLDFYVDSPRPREEFPYPQSLAGLEQYRADVERVKPEFPSLLLLFGPEMPPRMELARIPQAVIEMSDFFICEYPYGGESVDENTAGFVNRLREAQEFVAETGKPLYIAHPFREAVNRRLVKREIEPWVTSLEPRADGAFALDELNRFFGLDLLRVGEAARASGVPLEINGNTDQRVRASNLPATLQMLRAAYRLLHEAGASFVPGSDQHRYGSGTNRMGGYVPFETFALLGVTPAQIPFLNHFGISPNSEVPDSK